MSVLLALISRGAAAFSPRVAYGSMDHGARADEDSRRWYRASIERNSLGRDGLATSDWQQRSGSQHFYYRGSRPDDLRRATASRRSPERMHDRSAGWKRGLGEGCDAAAHVADDRWREVYKGQRWRKPHQDAGNGDGPTLL
jgi:hypothetical protein